MSGASEEGSRRGRGQRARGRGSDRGGGGEASGGAGSSGLSTPAARPYSRGGASSSRGETVNRMLRRHGSGVRARTEEDGIFVGGVDGFGGGNVDLVVLDEDEGRTRRLAAVERIRRQRGYYRPSPPRGRGRSRSRSLSRSPDRSLHWVNPVTDEVETVVPRAGRGKFKPGSLHTESRGATAGGGPVTISTGGARPTMWETGAEFRKTRGLSSARVEGDMLLAEFRKLKMTAEIPCRSPYCRIHSGRDLRERWQVNWIIPGRLLRRMICDHCGLEYILFGAGGEFEDLSLIQVLVMSRPDYDMFDLGFPKGKSLSFYSDILDFMRLLLGFESWKHFWDVMMRFLSINRAWSRVLSFDDWATCRSTQLRVLGINPNGVHGVREVADCVTHSGMPETIKKGPAPDPQRPRVPERYSSSLMKIESELGDHPQRFGLFWYARERTPWRDVGEDELGDEWYVGTGGAMQNQPPLCIADLIHIYWVEGAAEKERRALEQRDRGAVLETDRRRSSEESEPIMSPGRFGYTVSPADSVSGRHLRGLRNSSGSSSGIVAPSNTLDGSQFTSTARNLDADLNAATEALGRAFDQALSPVGEDGAGRGAVQFPLVPDDFLALLPDPVPAIDRRTNEVSHS